MPRLFVVLLILLPYFTFGQNFFKVFDDSERDESASNLIVEDSTYYLINSNSYEEQTLYKLNSEGEPLWSLKLYEDEFNDAFTREDTVLTFTAEELVYPENILRSALYSTHTGDFIRFEEDSVSTPQLEGTFQTVLFYPGPLLKNDSIQYVSLYRSAASFGINQVGLLASRKNSEEVFSTTICNGARSPVVNFIGPNGLAYGYCVDEYGNPTYFNYDIESNSMSTMWSENFNGPPPTWYVLPKIEFGSLSDRLYYTLSKKSYNRTLLVETKDLEGHTLCSNIIEVLSSEHIVSHASAACANDDILVTGTHSTDGRKREIVWRFNKNCEMIWEKELNLKSYGVEHQFTITEIKEMFDGSILLAGSINDPFIENKRTDMFVMSIDADEFLTEAICDTISVDSEFPEDSLMHSLVILNHPNICPEDSIAQVQVFAKGGIPPYSYQIIGSDIQESPTFDNLSSGDYQFQVFDANGQIDTIDYTISPVSFVNIYDVRITGNDIEIQVSGNGSPYECSIDGGATFTDCEDFIDLANGTYQAVVKNSYGCISNTYEFTIDFLLELQVDSESRPCFDSSDGQVTLLADGLYPPFTYSMNQVELDSSTITNLSDGTYDFSVKDSLGNIANLYYELEEYAEVVFNTEVDLNCIEFSRTSNNRVEEISIDGGVTFIDFPSGGVKIPELENGVYQVVARDRYGCLSDIQEVTVDYLLHLEIESVINPCYDQDNGQITLNAFGQYPPFTFQLDGVDLDSNVVAGLSSSSNIELSVVDSLGNIEVILYNLPSDGDVDFYVESDDDWILLHDYNFWDPSIKQYSIDGGLTFTDFIFSYDGTLISNLENGTYHIVCKGFDTDCLTDTLTVEIDYKIEIYNSFISNEICHGGQDGYISLWVRGPNPPFSYQLNDGPLQQSPIFENLGAGNYIIKITNSTGDEESFEFTITEREVLDFSTVVSGDTIQIIPEDDSGFTRYSISNGAIFVNYSTFTNLQNGDYFVSIKDINNCQSLTDTITVFVPLKLEVVTQDLSCHASADGEIQLEVEGEFPPFQTTLNSVDYDTLSTFNGLSAGVYDVTVLDSLGNEESIEVTLDEPPPILFNVEVIENSITIIPEYYYPFYLYSISGGITFSPDLTFPNLSNGEYQVLIKNHADCLSEVKTVEIDFISSIQEANQLYASIYPNPTRGLLNIELDGSTKYPIQVEILNTLGQEVFAIFLKEDQRKHRLNIQQLGRGAYVVKLTDKNNQILLTEKINIVD